MTDLRSDIAHSSVRPARRRYRPGSLEIFGLILLTAVLLRTHLAALLNAILRPGWATVFVAICVQATPFLVLGVLVSGAIAAFVPASFFTRVMPNNAALAVPLAGVCGMAFVRARRAGLRYAAGAEVRRHAVHPRQPGALSDLCAEQRPIVSVAIRHGGRAAPCADADGGAAG